MEEVCDNFQENKIIIKPHLLIVEGCDEFLFLKYFFEYLISKDEGLWGNLEKIQIWKSNGKFNLENELHTLPTLVNFRSVKSITIIQDADDNRLDTFHQIQSVLKKNGWSQPENELESVRCKLKTNTSFLLMVYIIGINNSGMLEDICLESVSNDTAMKCVDTYFSCLSNVFPDKLRFSNNKFSKAKARVFLASCKDPTIYIGLAAKKGYWNFDSDSFCKLKEVLLKIIQISEESDTH